MARNVIQNKWERIDVRITRCNACGNDHQSVRFSRCVLPRGVANGRYDVFTGVCPSTGLDVKLSDYQSDGRAMPVYE